MFENEATLTPQLILEKDFSIDAKGYRMFEVDKFLDIIIKDYTLKDKNIEELKSVNKGLNDEIEKLNKEIKNLRSIIEAFKNEEKEVTNVDILRRLSQLEKLIYGREQE